MRQECGSRRACGFWEILIFTPGKRRGLARFTESTWRETHCTATTARATLRTWPPTLEWRWAVGPGRATPGILITTATRTCTLPMGISRASPLRTSPAFSGGRWFQDRRPTPQLRLVTSADGTP